MKVQSIGKIREGAKKDSRRVELAQVTMDATVAMTVDRNCRIHSKNESMHTL